MPTRVLVTGDRAWHCYELAERVVARLVARYGGDLVIVHGAAPGVVSAFDRAAILVGVRREPFPADWRRHGDAAGPIRNQAMLVAGASFAIAVHRDLARSRGTRDMVRRCLAAGVPVYLIDSDAGEPVRVREVPGRA